MAVFLLKAEHGSATRRPAAPESSPTWPARRPFADWIEQLAAEGITGGLRRRKLLPDNPNTRGQMAVFLVKTFG